MPPIQVVFYQEGDKVPVRDWIDDLTDSEQDACYERVARLRSTAMNSASRQPNISAMESGNCGYVSGKSVCACCIFSMDARRWS